MGFFGGVLILGGGPFFERGSFFYGGVLFLGGGFIFGFHGLNLITDPPQIGLPMDWAHPMGQQWGFLGGVGLIIFWGGSIL